MFSIPLNENYTFYKNSNYLINLATKKIIKVTDYYKILGNLGQNPSCANKMFDKACALARAKQVFLGHKPNERSIFTTVKAYFVKNENAETKIKCDTCKKYFPKSMINIDHIIPICMGGKTETKNLGTSCCNCHAYKTEMERKYYPTKRRVA